MDKSKNKKSEDQLFTPSPLRNGGAEEDRTPDPHNAIVVLYQLSYDPIPNRYRAFAVMATLPGLEPGLSPWKGGVLTARP